MLVATTSIVLSCMEKLGLPGEGLQDMATGPGNPVALQVSMMFPSCRTTVMVGKSRTVRTRQHKHSHFSLSKEAQKLTVDRDSHFNGDCASNVGGSEGVCAPVSTHHVHHSQLPGL